MTDPVLQLLSIASEPILTPPVARELCTLNSVGSQNILLYRMLSTKNGCYAFESALHLFPLGRKDGILDLETWNSGALWRSEYKDLTEGCFFFSEDVFGVQFCFRQESILTFDPETGRTEPFALNLHDWAGKLLADYSLHTGYALAHEWQKQNRPLKASERLLPKTPFVLGGAYAVENLYASGCVEGMKFRAGIALQLRDLPDGSKVRLRVKR